MKSLKSKPAAVVFDMDGVIVDSMPYHFIAWYEALRPFGVRVSCFDVYAKEGEKWDKSVHDFLVKAHVKPNEKIKKQIFECRKRIFKKYFQRFIFQGADDFIHCLKNKGYKLALVTGTHSRGVNNILPKTLRQVFDVIVTGDCVKQGKPHPEPYLTAASKLGVMPGECVVIENAPYGIESAKRAGMFCFGVTTSLPKEYLKKADIVVDELHEIYSLLDVSCNVTRPQKKRK